MKLSFRVRALNVGLLVLMGVGLAAGQEEAAPIRAVLAQGEVRYVAPAIKADAPRPGARKPSLVAASTSALNVYAPYFGISDPDTELQQFRVTSRGGEGDILRYRQLHEGYPVIGGELVLSLDGLGLVNSLSGEVARNLKLRNLQPAVSAAQARQTALAAMAKYYPELGASLVTSEPALWVYDPKLIGPQTGDARLVWRMNVTTRGAATALRELVLINAGDGGLALHFNQIDTALAQQTYTASEGSALPGTQLCTEAQANCTGGTNTDADLAHRHARDTYNFYFTHHGRDSFDNLGGALISTVNYLETNRCPNAFWNGAQMVYCTGAPAADDVVAHELTHAVTDRTSDLFYYYQSGAINESLSDVWGEFVDLTNGSGNDSPAVRWLGGEDFTGVGAIRNMANPPQFGDPDRMSSSLYANGAADNGGVHRNSGINNKAVTLMVDGGSFRGYTVTGIGIDKVAALYYRVQTQHLTSGSDYADLYLALAQACRNMIGGADGITAGDCVQVANATSAVEMNQLPAQDVNGEAPLCSINQVPTDEFFESAEDADSLVTRWSSAPLTGAAGVWSRLLLGTHGVVSFATPGVDGTSNYVLTKTQPVVVPANAFLHFRHLFEQEQANGNWDGGIVEYSTNGGSSWSNANTLYSAGRNYTGTLTASSNPAAGSLAFVGASHGFVSTRYNLASLAGQNLQIRFRNTSDSSVRSGLAWAVDEIRIYTCGADGSVNVVPIAAADVDQTVGPAETVTLDGSGSSDPDGYITSANWSQISGIAVATVPSGRLLSFIAPVTPAQEQLVFRLTVTDNRGAVTTDDMTVTVSNQQPVANAGTDQSRKPRDVVLLQATATDGDGTISNYSWSQLSGPAAGLNKVFNTALQGATTQSIWLSTTPMAPGAALLRLNFTVGALTNFGGAIGLGAGSEYAICLQVTGLVCTVRHSLPLAGSLMAPAVADASPRTWTLQSVHSGSTVVTGSFVFNATNAAVSNIQITSPSPAGPVLSFVVPSVSGAAAMNFRVTSTDNYGGTGTDDVAIGVSNSAPTANAGADRSVKAGAKVNLAGSGIDADGTITGYSWVQTGGAAVAITAATTATAQFKAPSGAEAVTLVFQLTTTDNDGGTAVDLVTISVAAKSGGGGSLDLWMLLALLGLLAGRAATQRRCRIH